MAILEFKSFLINEEKPKEFEEFRKISSKIYNEIEGEITFTFIKTYSQFEITKNETNKNDIELKKMLGEYSNYLI